MSATTLTYAPTPRTAPVGVRAAARQLPTYTLQPPAGVDQWRERVELDSLRQQITWEQVLVVLEGVRSADDRSVVMERAGLSAAHVLDVVAGVGARIGQANKSGKRPVALSLVRGAAQGMAPGVHCDTTGQAVVLSGGWSRVHGSRDVARSYAAIATAAPERMDASARRWFERRQCEVDVNYHHLAHLYAVSRGYYPSLVGLSDDVNVQRAHVRAYDLLANGVADAQRALGSVLQHPGDPARVRSGLVACSWLLGPVARPVVGALRSGASGPALAQAVARVSAWAQRTPRACFPRTIGELSQIQFRALCSHLGFPVPADDAGLSQESVESSLAAALEAARGRAERQALDSR